MYYFNSKNLLEIRGNDVQCSKVFSGAITELKINLIERSAKMAEQKEPEFIFFLGGRLKLQLFIEHLWMKKTEAYQRRSYTTKDINKGPIFPRQVIHKQVIHKIITTGVFSPRSKGCKPHIRLPSLGVFLWENKTFEYLALKACKSYFQEGYGKQRLHS